MNEISEEQKPFVALADQILSITQKDDQDPKENSEDGKKVKALEHQLDQLVYKLYDLTPEEIKIVEENLEKEQ